MIDDEFAPVEKIYIIIYNKDHEEVARLAGRKDVHGTQWEDEMPITIDYVKETTELLSRIEMMKGEKDDTD